MASPTKQPAAAQATANQGNLNAQFMRYSFMQPISASAQNGTTYASGTNLNFDFPITPGAYACKLQIDYDITFNYAAAGASPYATVNAAAPWNVFQEVSVSYGNRQITMNPYLAKVLKQAQGYDHYMRGDTLITESSNTKNAIYKFSPTIAAGSNEWKGSIDFNLNAIHPLSPQGLIPMGGSGTRGQVQLIPAVGFTGPDPLQNCISTNGTISNVTGTVTVTIWYRDYKSLSTPSALQLDLTGLPTAQIVKMREINPLTQGTVNNIPFTNPYATVKLITLVIDGQSSGTFCNSQNIQAYRMDSAENSNNGLLIYDQTNGGINNYYKQTFEKYGVDFDDGVLLYNANAMNTVNVSNMDGDAFLNLTAGGYPAGRLGIQVGTVSQANGITPRVVTYGVIQNPQGIH